LFVPVAVTQTSFKRSASPMERSLISTLFRTMTSASFVRSRASSGVEKGYFTTSPNASKLDKSMSSPMVFASKKTIFISRLLLFN
jgi:DNA-binding transcriptional regulator GbsR (MarR family)